MVHADDLVVQLIVCAGVGQERVPKRNEQVEDVDNLSTQENVASDNLRTHARFCPRPIAQSPETTKSVSGHWAVGLGQNRRDSII